MKIHRFFGDFNFLLKNIVIDDDEIVHQIRNVLKLRVGEKIILCGHGLKQSEAAIIQIAKKTVAVEVSNVIDSDTESAVRVSLYCSILKRDNFEWVVQKAVEVGVNTIVPIICSRTIKNKLNLERLRKIAQEAAEQSQRGIVPLIQEPQDYQSALKFAQANDSNIICHRSEQKFESFGSGDNLGIFIGPEGGWTDDELAQAAQAKFQVLSLGKTMLRAETAAVVASYVAVNQVTGK